MCKTVEIDGKKFSLIPEESECESLEIMRKGKNYLIRGVTHYSLGRFAGFVTEGKDTFAIMHDACWVADTGRHSDAITKGTLNEVEWTPKAVIRVNLGAVMDIFDWAKDLPSAVK